MRLAAFQNPRRALTLVEVLVCIGVIAVLLSLLLPALFQARRHARDLLCVNNCRTCGLAITAYANDFKDCYPLFGSPASVLPSFENGGAAMAYFDQAFCWPIVVSSYLNADRFSRSWLCASQPALPDLLGDGPDSFERAYPASYVMTADFWMSFTLFTESRRWGATPFTGDEPSVRRGMRVSEVLSPSQKGMLIEPMVYHRRAQTTGLNSTLFDPASPHFRHPTAFVDGHDADLNYDTFTVPSRADPTPAPVLSTLNGFLGRDVP